MKIFSFLFLFITINSYSQQLDSIIDGRDGKIYKTVKIGNQWWFAENLAYIPFICPPEEECGCWIYDYYENSVFWAKINDNYKKNGCLYDWFTASNSCPFDWHLPTDEDWNYLENYLNSKNKDNEKNTSLNYDENEITKYDLSLDFKYTGIKTLGGSFINKEYSVYYWTSTIYDKYFVYTRSLNKSDSAILRTINQKYSGFSVRCVKN